MQKDKNRKQRKKKLYFFKRKIVLAGILVLFAFTVCKSVELLLEKEPEEAFYRLESSGQLVEKEAEELSSEGITEISPGENDIELTLMGSLLKEVSDLEADRQADIEKFLVLQTVKEEAEGLPVLPEKKYVGSLRISEKGLTVSEEVLETLYRRDYAIHYISERQKNGSPKDRETFYGLLETKYTEEYFSNYYNFVNNFYIVDTGTVAVKSLFNGTELLQKDMSVEKNLEEPQILIYHTHSLESFADSREGVIEDSIVGIGSYLAELLSETYGYQVLHDTTAYDINKYGYGDRDNAYQRVTPALEALLEKYPSIEIIIDLHRDSREGKVVTVDGKEMAQIMLFNGLCRNTKGPYTRYTNEYLSENLAFSLQLYLMGEALYPGLMRKTYIKSDQYNLHFRAHSLLVELGTEENTIEQARNAMDLFADILNEVLTLKSE